MQRADPSEGLASSHSAREVESGFCRVPLGEGLWAGVAGEPRPARCRSHFSGEHKNLTSPMVKQMKIPALKRVGSLRPRPKLSSNLACPGAVIRTKVLGPSICPGQIPRTILPLGPVGWATSAERRGGAAAAAATGTAFCSRSVLARANYQGRMEKNERRSV